LLLRIERWWQLKQLATNGYGNSGYVRCVSFQWYIIKCGKLIAIITFFSWIFPGLSFTQQLTAWYRSHTRICSMATNVRPVTPKDADVVLSDSTNNQLIC
jgi:hypothetical protein